ncbi:MULTISPECIES: hypothetical protein [Streptomyces]|uniref:hypothetical protein n=1 Tax=Streptomyces TaxID=1883 RepID=UPI00117ED0CB|nr:MULTISPECIES: hypothetical protein [Streptomyces]MDX2551195.1 hypothetical protein [Streptomyces stelliscabiei]MDX2615339.1 hypothetical protein [Streptomyces stelliscabiei]MDX2633855.1 hypothetical protein [Streptomyces stelliscabiei]MDX2664308.1 hypothetical protein [Streptomyces stelliscabiei]MDX2786596.1 hypothetical protein [Streptomyces stelliscabiei]
MAASRPPPAAQERRGERWLTVRTRVAAAPHGAVVLAGRRDARGPGPGGRPVPGTCQLGGAVASAGGAARWDTVGLLHETGDFGAYETITFRRVPVTALT